MRTVQPRSASRLVLAYALRTSRRGRATTPAAVSELVLTLPPARVDLLNEVMANWGRHATGGTNWPPMAALSELSWRTKRVHCGEVRLRGAGRGAGDYQ